VSIAEYGGERISVFMAGFDNLSGKALSNFDSLGNASAFSNQARHVRAGAQVPSTFEGLHLDADGHFLDLRQMHLSFHDVLPNDG